MNYAQTHHIRNSQPTQTKTATSFAPTVGRVCQLDAKTKRRKPSAEGQAEIRTHSHATNGILKCTFLPKLKTAQSGQSCQKTERDFYQSLSQLAEHYSINPMHTRAYHFPYNIVLGMWDIETQLKRTHRNWDTLKLVRDGKKAFLVSGERCDLGTSLYYIPIIPLFQMLHDKKRKKNGQLLLSVYSYLYHIADIPYYRQENSYLYWLYEMHKEWVEEDDETEDTETYKRELRDAEYIGEKTEKKIFNRKNLTVFEHRLKYFKTRDAFDRECQRIACNASALYTQYPQASIFRNAPLAQQDPHADDYENMAIVMENYISFIADTKGWLYESLRSSINNEFNEYGAMQEPTICKHFDGSAIQSNLDFENRLFDLSDDLCSLLYNYETTKK